MRIAIFSDNFYPEISGISDTIILTAKELAKRGHEIRFFVPRYSRKDYRFVGLPFAELDLGGKISITRIPSFPFKAGTGQGRFVLPLGFSLMGLQKFRPDLIHVHLPFGAGIEGLMASRLFRIPLVGTSHTLIAEYARYIPIRLNLIKRLIVAYYDWFYNRCDLVSSPANYIFESSKIKVPHEVVPNSVELDIFGSSRGNKKKHGLSGFTLLYSGRLAAEKNIDVIIRAVSKLKGRIPKINLALAGKGAFENDLKSLAKSLNVEDSVKFLGFLLIREEAQVYNSSEIFVIVSSVEVQSIAAMKAMASSLPVIAAESSGMREYIKGNGFLVDPQDADGLAEKIMFLYKNPGKRREMGDKGRRDVKRFSPPSIAKKWELIYQRLSKKSKQK